MKLQIAASDASLQRRQRIDALQSHRRSIPIPGGTQSFASAAAATGQVPRLFPATFIARSPALEAKFHVSQAPGALRLAGYIRKKLGAQQVLNRSAPRTQREPFDTHWAWPAFLTSHLLQPRISQPVKGLP